MSIKENIKRLRLQAGLTQAKSDKTIAMRQLFQIFRQYDGYFDSYGNLKFKKLPLSAWKHQWEIYQKELTQAKTIKNKQERDYTIEDAEDKFNYWMDIYPKSDCYNISFDKSWHYYQKTKNSKKNHNNNLEKKENASKSNSVIEELNWQFECTTFIDHSTIILRNDQHTLGSIQYSVNNSCLHIEDIYTRISDFECSINYSRIHAGTVIFNQVLLQLNREKNNINKITGMLSCVDAYNRNWHKSIPFYADFNLHLHEDLPYQLEFHLFSDSYYENEVDLPTDQSDRKIFIKIFSEEHIKSNTWASFKYDVIPKIT